MNDRSKSVDIFAQFVVDHQIQPDDLNFELCQRIVDLRRSLEWLVNLHHGVSKNGESPTDAEWKECLKETRLFLEGGDK